MTSDLTFITNEEDKNLLNRFATLIKDTRFFDCLVGYFYTSGFYSLYKSLENNGRITNEEARNICGVNRNQSLRLIRKLIHKGFLRKIGKGRGAYYEKC